MAYLKVFKSYRRQNKSESIIGGLMRVRKYNLCCGTELQECHLDSTSSGSCVMAAIAMVMLNIKILLPENELQYFHYLVVIIIVLLTIIVTKYHG
jgi:hypothetical protein